MAHAAVGKRLWSYVRAALFMARNGKRKLLLSMHLLGANNKRKAVTRAVASLLTHHSHGPGATAYALHRRGDYEFSCTNSPAAVSSSSRRRLAYFPCLGAAVAQEEHDHGYDGHGSLSLPDAEPLARIQYYAAAASSSSSSSLGDLDLAPGEEKEEEEEEEHYYACAPSSSSSSPTLLLRGAASGDFSVRVSNYSSEDNEGAGGSDAVDADAEEFIRRFYDQLRRQNTVAPALLPYYYYMQQQQQETVAAA